MLAQLPARHQHGSGERVYTNGVVRSIGVHEQFKGERSLFGIEIKVSSYHIIIQKVMFERVAG